MKFSTGGQYLVIVEPKFFIVYSSYTLEILAKCKSVSLNITSISFNERDTCFGMVSQDGFVYRFDLVNMKVKGEGDIDKKCDFRSCIFLKDPTDEFKMLAVGSENKRVNCRVYDENDNKELNY